ncbi:LysR family transcriptional regulator [Romboutsia weinsteinii]|uniref:LysR family transcriptional regulator n=1 Tax=Romboutsia weinsteinii TaxID=2020949 RepID=A0A371J683_9FIRM|nr:LysR family transcriptional regulator [Romboutsia weinsteinii]RDY28244.1 LysR family transcriptional regulator [Romboutsia weinsteinii]
MIDFRLITFIDLCETKNYTKTAKNLSITQPAVSQHIRYLEEKYNLKLFDYISKKLSLTQEGIDFLNNVQKLQTMSINIEHHLKDSNSRYKSLVFGATRTIGEYYIPPYIKKYISLYPKNNISMIVNNTKFLLENLNKGNIEFAIIEGHFNKAEYETHLISKERLVVVASPQNKLASKNNISFDELFSETLIVREKGSGSREIFEMFLYENNFTYKNFEHVIEIGNIGIIKDIVKSNLGISIMYEMAAQTEITNNELAVLDINNMSIFHEYNFIFLNDSIFKSNYIDFYNFLRD